MRHCSCFVAALTLLAAAHAPAAAMLVPAYFHPGDHAAEWSALTDAARTVGVTAVFNPASGPGTAIDPAYAPALSALRAAGGKAVAYVHTKNTDGSLCDFAAVQAEVDAYRTLYGGGTFDGYFIDEMSSSTRSAQVTFYTNLYNYIKSKSAAYTVIGNPGTNVPQAYSAAADVLVTCEDVQAAYADYEPSAWTQTQPASRFATILHDAPAATLAASLRQAKAQNVGYVYVTDDGADGNPYDSLPGYFQAEVAALVPEPAGLAVAGMLAAFLLRRKW